jgi:hypothetical protein
MTEPHSPTVSKLTGPYSGTVSKMTTTFCYCQ